MGGIDCDRRGRGRAVRERLLNQRETRDQRSGFSCRALDADVHLVSSVTTFGGSARNNAAVAPDVGAELETLILMAKASPQVRTIPAANRFNRQATVWAEARRERKLRISGGSHRGGDDNLF
jgi:hypothetical protein